MARSRSRYRSDIRRKTRYQLLELYPGQTPPVEPTFITNTSVEFETMVDQTIPSQKKRRATLSDAVRDRIRRVNANLKRGILRPFHIMDYSLSSKTEPETQWVFDNVFTTSTSRVLYRIRATGNYTQWHNLGGRPMPSWPSLPAGHVSDMIIRAQTQALLFLDKPKQSLGEPIAELRTLPRDLSPTLSSIERISRRYKRDIEAFKLRSKGANSLAITRYAASKWAQYSFFIGPLVRTANEISTDYATKFSVPSLFQTARGFSELRTLPAFKTTTLTAGGWKHTWEQMRWAEVMIQAGIVYSSPDRVSTVPGMLGLVTRDLPVTAWELAPLSFIIDRVINVKRFIRSAMALSSSKVKIYPGSFTTIRYKDVRMARVGDISNVASFLTKSTMSPGKTPWYREEDFSYNRVPWTPDLGAVVATARGDGLANSLSKLADVAALSLRHLT